MIGRPRRRKTYSCGQPNSTILVERPHEFQRPMQVHIQIQLVKSRRLAPFRSFSHGYFVSANILGLFSAKRPPKVGYLRCETGFWRMRLPSMSDSRREKAEWRLPALFEMRAGDAGHGCPNSRCSAIQIGSDADS